MLALRRKLAAATDRQIDALVTTLPQVPNLREGQPPPPSPLTRSLYQRQIQATDRQIDALVYELYGLTEEEIAVVEGKYSIVST